MCTSGGHYRKVSCLGLFYFFMGLHNAQSHLAAACRRVLLLLLILCISNCTCVSAHKCFFFSCADARHTMQAGRHRSLHCYKGVIMQPFSGVLPYG